MTTTVLVDASSRSLGTRTSRRPNEFAVAVRGLSVTWASAAGAAMATTANVAARTEMRLGDIGFSLDMK